MRNCCLDVGMQSRRWRQAPRLFFMDRVLVERHRPNRTTICWYSWTVLWIVISKTGSATGCMTWNSKRGPWSA